MVVLWGDHGWHLGDHGLWCKHTNFEQATHSPLIISAPGFPKAGKTKKPTEFVDVFPTLCELAGVPIPKNLDGTSLVPILKDSSASVKDYAVSQWPRGRTMGYAIRDGRYRYVEWFSNKNSTQPYDSSQIVGRELYDYEKDPLETKNLVDVPEYKAVVEKMNQRMKTFFKAQK